MFETYADSLPEKMTAVEFLKMLKEGELMQKLMSIAEELSQKTDL